MKPNPKLIQVILTLVIAILATSCAKKGVSAFDHADKNQDNQLSVAELEVALTEAIFIAADSNGDGIVTFEEWKLVFPKADEKNFAASNTDGQPGITLAEATVAIDKKGTFDKLLAKIDTNGDSIVSKEEAAVFYDAYQAAEGSTELEKLENVIES